LVVAIFVCFEHQDLALLLLSLVGFLASALPTRTHTQSIRSIIMEVASPLTFQPAGTKRSFMCSPPAMDVSDDYCVQAKRRRFGDPSSPFLSSSTIGTANSPFAQSYNTGRMGGGTGGKSWCGKPTKQHESEMPDEFLEF
jgi:hypothetical protein